MQEFARVVLLGLVLLSLTSGGVQAADVTSHWVGGSFAWSVPSNWDNGVPDNSGGDSYTAVVDLAGARVIPTISGLQITNLQLLEGQIESTSSLASFTVLNVTTIDPAKITDMFSGTKPAAIFKITVTGTNKVTYNLGDFSGESGGTLIGGRYDLTSRSATSEAFVAWPGAAIATIGEDAEVLLSDIGPAGFRNSLNSSDALAGVTRNEGIFKMVDRGFAFSGSFTNAGEFAINEAIALGPTTDPIVFITVGDFSNESNAIIQSNSSVTNFNIGGNFSNSGILQTTLSNFSGVPQMLTPAITGNLVNTGNLVFRADDQEVTWNIGGTISNTNEIRLDSNGADLTIHAGGGFAGFGSGTLPSGTYRLLATEPGDFATVSAPGTDILTIGLDASIELEGAGASFLNSTSGMSALGSLATVDGAFKVLGQTLALAGGFANHGTLEYSSDSEFGAQVLTINGGFSNTGQFEVSAFNFFGETGAEARATALGPLAENAGGLLSAGQFTVDAGINASAILEWPGAQINSIAGGAGITLRGPGSQLRDQVTMGDALTGLSSNAGMLWFDTRNASAPGSFVNDNGAGEPAEFLVWDAVFSIGGSFTNTGETLIRGSEVPTSFTVATGISNTGVLGLSAFSANVIASVSGPLAEQVGTTLQEGEFAVSAGGGLSAIFEYHNASIATIGPDAKVAIDGAGAVIRDKLSGTDALIPFADIQGFLRLNDGKTRVTVGNLFVSGEFDFRNANTRVSGNFTNTGATYFNSGGSAGKLMIVDGAFSSPGELYVYTGGTFRTNSPLLEQSGTVLNDGEFYAFGGVIEWNGAAITQIGADAAIGLSGAASVIKDSSTSANALAALAGNDGFFYLDDYTFTFAGDFVNTGETELNTGVTLVMNPGSTLSSSGAFENGGDTTLTGGVLDLLDGGFFDAWDYFAGFAPGFEPIYEFAKLTAPEIRIDGELYLELYDLVPDPAAEYTILEAPVMTGAFDNVAFGGRIDVFNGNNESEDEVLGSFMVNYDPVAGRVYLSEFEPAPAGGQPEIQIVSFEIAGTQATIVWTVSDGSGADVYFSEDLMNWGSPVATGILTGTYIHPFLVLPGEGFFVVVPEETGPP